MTESPDPASDGKAVRTRWSGFVRRQVEGIGHAARPEADELCDIMVLEIEAVALRSRKRARELRELVWWAHGAAADAAVRMAELRLKHWLESADCLCETSFHLVTSWPLVATIKRPAVGTQRCPGVHCRSCRNLLELADACTLDQDLAVTAALSDWTDAVRPDILDDPITILRNRAASALYYYAEEHGLPYSKSESVLELVGCFPPEVVSIDEQPDGGIVVGFEDPSSKTVAKVPLSTLTKLVNRAGVVRRNFESRRDAWPGSPPVAP